MKIQVCEIDRVLAIDPGPALSAYLILDRGIPTVFNKISNERLLGDLISYFSDGVTTLACEMIQAQGMGVGAETFETVFWTGRYFQRWPGNFVRMYRRQVKSHICGSQKAKDSNIRIAIIDKFGGVDKAIGGKKCRVCKGKQWVGRDHKPCHCNGGWELPPGPLNGISNDCWSALAVAITWRDTVFKTAESVRRNPEPSAASSPKSGAASSTFGFRKPVPA